MTLADLTGRSSCWVKLSTADLNTVFRIDFNKLIAITFLLVQKYK